MTTIDPETLQRMVYAMTKRITVYALYWEHGYNSALSMHLSEAALLAELRGAVREVIDPLPSRVSDDQLIEYATDHGWVVYVESLVI